MLGREAALSQAPRAGTWSGGAGAAPTTRGTHITPLRWGKHDHLPTSHLSTRGCGSPHLPLGGAPAVRGSVPSGQYQDPHAPPALGTGQVAAGEPRYLRYFRYLRPSNPMCMSRGEGTLASGSP